jgi:hypothetical protein
MDCFVDFVTSCSSFVGTGQDEPGDPVNERDLVESDLGTEDNEGNEEMSTSRSSCGASIQRRAIVCGTNAPANARLGAQTAHPL